MVILHNQNTHKIRKSEKLILLTKPFILFLHSHTYKPNTPLGTTKEIGIQVFLVHLGVTISDAIHASYIPQIKFIWIVLPQILSPH